MKKALVILLALFVVGFSFADDVAFSVAGSASMTFGFNLNDNSAAFSNAATATLTIPLVATQDKTAKGEGDVYGEITLAGIYAKLIADDKVSDTAVVIDSKNVDSITAKIVAGPLSVTIFGAPGFELNNAQFFKPFYNDDFSDGSLKPNVSGTTGGFTVGYKLDVATIALKVASIGDTDGVEETATDNKFAIGAVVDLTPADLIAINAAFNMSTVDASAKNFTAKATLKPITGVAIVGAIDGSLPDSGDMLMDIAASAAYTFDNADAFSLAFYMQDVAGHNGDLQVKFVEDADKGFVPVLGASFAVQIYDLLASPAADPMNLVVAGAFDYKVMMGDVNYFKPYAKAAYELVGEDMYLNVGAEFVLFPKVVFTADFAQGSKANDQVAADPIVVNADDKGMFTFKTKISY